MKKAMVYGESAEALLGTMSKSDQSIADDGMHQFELRMTPDEAGPIVRAHMRAEAELLLEDADSFDPHEMMRTPDQRRADALVKVVTSASIALAGR